jgi:hypothetical protein
VLLLPSGATKRLVVLALTCWPGATSTGWKPSYSTAVTLAQQQQQQKQSNEQRLVTVVRAQLAT